MLKLKKNYKRKYDKHKKIYHIYPTNGRAHYFDKCWCSPIKDKNGDLHHNYSKDYNTPC